MLFKELQMLSKTDITKTRDPEKLAHTLSKFTNLIGELVSLAKQYKIEDIFYYGDVLPKIYQQLGDGRMTRFLSTIDDDPSERETWQRLLTFLDKEEKLNQHKLLILGPQNEKKELPANQPSTQRRYNNRKPNSYHNKSITSNQDQCQFCGESPCQDEHVESNGPGGVKIIQYYICKKFAEKTSAARLSSIRDKGFCIQCLLPGADASNGKHLDGECQGDFIYPHPSHQRYPVKKHVLLCEEHKEDQSNQDVLEKFKNRCMKNTTLPDFSRQIKLGFHVNAFSSHTSSPLQDSVRDKRIFKLQTITVNGKRLNAFFDDGCINS